MCWSLETCESEYQNPVGDAPQDQPRRRPRVCGRQPLLRGDESRPAADRRRPRRDQAGGGGGGRGP